VKKIDYYAVHQPWRMPKWLGATLGGIFGFIVIISGVAIVKLTASPSVAAAAVAGLPSAMSAAQTPVATPAAQPAIAAPAPAQTAVAQTTAPAPAAAKHHGKHVAASHHATHVASKRFKGGAVVLANAKHDRHKIGEKDALDKLLGL
jgi:hypothetical protein